MPHIHSMVCYRFVTPAFANGQTRGTTADGKPWDIPSMSLVDSGLYAARMDNLAVAWSVAHEMHRDCGVSDTHMHRDPDYTKCNCEARAMDAANCARTAERTLLIRVWLEGDPETTPWPEPPGGS